MRPIALAVMLLGALDALAQARGGWDTNFCAASAPEACEREAAALVGSDPSRAQQLYLAAASAYQQDCDRRQVSPCGKALDLYWSYGRPGVEVSDALVAAFEACEKSPGPMCIRAGDALWLGFGVKEDREVARALYAHACKLRSYLCKRHKDPTTAEAEAPLAWKLDSPASRFDLAQRAVERGDDQAAFEILSELVSQTRWQASHARADSALEPVIERLWDRLVEPELSGERAPGALRRGGALVTRLAATHPLRAQLAEAKARAAERYLKSAEAAPADSLRRLFASQLSAQYRGEPRKDPSALARHQRVALDVSWPRGCEWLSKHAIVTPDTSAEKVPLELGVTCHHEEKQRVGEEEYTYDVTELRRREVFEEVPVTKIVSERCGDVQRCFTTTYLTGNYMTHQTCIGGGSRTCLVSKTVMERRPVMREVPTAVPKTARRQVKRRELTASVQGILRLPGGPQIPLQITETKEEQAYRTPHGQSSFTSASLADQDRAAAAAVRAVFTKAVEEYLALRAAAAAEASLAAHASGDGDASLEKGLEALARGSADAALDALFHRRFGLSSPEVLGVLQGQAPAETAFPKERRPP